MEFRSKHFYDLTLDELYGILALRAEVFVVEQDCPYQDLDGIDKDAVHIFGTDGDEVVSCLRLFLKDNGDTAIGRVVNKESVRGTGIGKMLMMNGIAVARHMYHGRRCILHAQTYAIGFYEKCGFKVCSEEFLEDGIPHKEMELFL